MEFKCTCHNSGTNSFTGKCSNCGMTKLSQGVTISNSSEPYKTIHQNKSELEQFWIFDAGMIDGRILTPEELLGNKITKEEFYKNMKEGKLINQYSAKEFEKDYWIKQINNLQRYSPFNSSELVEDIDGKYILLSDALNLFSAENK